MKGIFFATTQRLRWIISKANWREFTENFLVPETIHPVDVKLCVERLTAWFLSHVIPLFKPGQERLNPSSYRPISLTSKQYVHNPRAHGKPKAGMALGAQQAPYTAPSWFP